MSTVITPSSPSVSGAIIPPPAPHTLDDFYRMNVDEYDRLADAGLLKDRRVELINGWLVRKMVTKPPHVIAVDATREAVGALLPRGWWLRNEAPMRIPEYDEPEPDISVVRGSRQDYRLRHPGPGDIVFVAEVSETSLSWDRGERQLAYAKAGVPLYWIVNLVDRQLDVFTSPAPDGYSTSQVFGPGDRATLVIDGLDVRTIAVADLLP